MIPTPRPVDLTDVDTHNIRHLSHCGTVGDLRVVVRELDARDGGVDLPGGTSHFFLVFRPLEAPKHIVTFKDNYEQSLGDGSLYFFAPSYPHAVEWPGAKGLVVQFLFEPAFLLDLTRSLQLDAAALSDRPRKRVSPDEPLETLCRLLTREVATGCPHGSEFFGGLSHALACVVVKRLTSVHAVARDPRVARAIRFIDRHFTERVTIKAVAQAVGLSPDHFVEVFCGAVSCTPQQYLIRCRLHYARQLIASEGHRRSLTDIALAAGFFDQAHLTRHFQRAFGQSPGQWRKQILKW